METLFKLVLWVVYNVLQIIRYVQRSLHISKILRNPMEFRKLPGHLSLILADPLQVRDILDWSIELGIHKLSLFLPNEESLNAVSRRLVSDKRVALYSSTTNPLDERMSDYKVQVELLGNEDGKSALVKQLRGLESLDLATATKELEKIGNGDPDLLMVVCGEDQLRLHGYNPWRLRLCQIFHCNKNKISKSEFLYALYLHENTEQRFGR